MISNESTFAAHLFSYDPATGAILKGGKRRDAGGGNRYRRVCHDSNRVLAHRLAWRIQTGEWPEHEVDHRNLDKHDNAWSNLRAATSAQNKCNNPALASSKTGERGVFFDAANERWCISLQFAGARFKRYCSSKISAILAARLIRRVLHGEFSHQTANLVS